MVWEFSIDVSADNSGFSYPSIVEANYFDLCSGNKFVAVEYKNKLVHYLTSFVAKHIQFWTFYNFCNKNCFKKKLVHYLPSFVTKHIQLWTFYNFCNKNWFNF